MVQKLGFVYLPGQCSLESGSHHSNQDESPDMVYEIQID